MAEESLPPPPAQHLKAILDALAEEETVPPEYITLVSWFAFHEAVHSPDMEADHNDIASAAILDETDFSFDGFRVFGFTSEQAPIYQPMISGLLEADHYVLLGLEPDGTPRYGTLKIDLRQTPEELKSMIRLTLSEVKNKINQGLF
jgi:hypothetical protein